MTTSDKTPQHSKIRRIRTGTDKNGNPVHYNQDPAHLVKQAKPHDPRFDDFNIDDALTYLQQREA